MNEPAQPTPSKRRQITPKPYVPTGVTGAMCAYLQTVPGAWARELAVIAQVSHKAVRSHMEIPLKHKLVHRVLKEASDGKSQAYWYCAGPPPSPDELPDPPAAAELADQLAAQDDDERHRPPRPQTVFSHAPSVFAAGMALLGECEQFAEDAQPTTQEEPPVSKITAAPAATTPPAQLDHDVELLPVEHDCEFAISSTGRLLIQSGGSRLAMPSDHVKQLVAYLAERFGFVAQGA